MTSVILFTNLFGSAALQQLYDEQLLSLIERLLGSEITR